MSNSGRAEESKRYWLQVSDEQKSMEAQLRSGGKSEQEISDTLDQHYGAAYDAFSCRPWQQIPDSTVRDFYLSSPNTDLASRASCSAHDAFPYLPLVQKVHLHLEMNFLLDISDCQRLRNNLCGRSYRSWCRQRSQCSTQHRTEKVASIHCPICLSIAALTCSTPSIP